jgi:glutamate/tyrosine decarboxylase-like PLP-dependent enzyme
LDASFSNPLFLGPQAENLGLFEDLLLEFVRDHAYWRKNFHPEDGAAISPSAQMQPEYLELVARMRSELQVLSAQLKRAVPFFSPRYVGHMNADLLLPGVIAKVLTTLYNPNNVSEEAAPVTLEKELEVGEQLARMFGYAVDEGAEPCAWGHLTSGGTVANYEALWNFRSLRFHALALAEAAAEFGFDPDPIGPQGKALSAYSKWELVNLCLDATIDMRQRFVQVMREEASSEQIAAFSRAVRSRRIESMGMAGFFQAHSDLEPPRVLVPSSAHYSWEKSMKVLGLGTENLIRIDVDRNMRLDIEHARRELEGCLERCTPVLAAVGVLGTTEFGTLDPIAGLVQVRNEMRGRGLEVGLHVDAAWGGYLASVFRAPDGSLRPREEMTRDFKYFPSEVVYDAFKALPEVDSITVDPHKLGFVPYAAGAFVARNRKVVDFVTQKAAYVFDLGEAQEEVPMREKLRKLGQYILEGSKSGASAAAVHVVHKVLPLHREGFGRLLTGTVRACEYFFDQVQALRGRIQDLATLSVPFEPDSNLICLAINPRGNRQLATMNAFMRELFAEIKVDPSQPCAGQAVHWQLYLPARGQHGGRAGRARAR